MTVDLVPARPDDARSAETAVPPAARTRRTLLAAAIGGVGAYVASAIGRSVPEAHAAPGGNLIIGQSNSGGSSQTVLTSSAGGAAFTLKDTAAAGTGIFGWASAASGGGRGLYGRADSGDGFGIQARNLAASSGTGAAIQALGEENVAIRATTTSADASVIVASKPAGGTAFAIDVSGSSYGIKANAALTGITGIGAGYGVRGETTGGTGVRGTASNGTGVWGSSSGFGTGVYGSNDAGGNGVVGTTASGSGVHGSTNNGFGVRGAAGSGNGVHGTSTSGTGVHGESSSGVGVYGNSPTNWSGLFEIDARVNGDFQVGGNMDVAGLFTKGSGSFKIDHPLDPAGKYLLHSFVESPDMKNVYDGLATLDARGQATITMPDWFEALNRDFRYQLTAIGRPAPDLHVKADLAKGRFVVAGGAAGQRVSWQVTGTRQDAFANANRIPIEVAKTGTEKGTYLHPEAHGQPASKRAPGKYPTPAPPISA